MPRRAAPDAEGEPCALRPVAEGFHHGGADEAAVDLGAVLTKELGRGRHCCLTLGDWIAVSHDDRTVRLVVAALHPERALCVLSTDLSVDVLPPMVVEERLRKAQAQSEKEQRLIEERRRRAAAARGPGFKGDTRGRRARARAAAVSGRLAERGHGQDQ